MDPILTESEDRFVLFPLKELGLWELYKKQVACFWTPEEIDLSSDLNEWKSLEEGERHFIKHVLAFFAASDGIVLENLAVRFLGEVQLPEARCFYSFQMAMEMIHSETYSLLIDAYISDRAEKTRLFKATQNFPSIKKKADWALKWIRPGAPFSERLVAFAIVEGVFFCGSFCAIFWLKKRNLLHGLTFSNELISRDESLHCQFACALYRKLQTRADPDRVAAIVREAVAIETEFVTEALPVDLIGMNKGLMAQYVRFVADHWLEQLGHEPIWRVENPFEFMKQISLDGKTNFFEKRVSEYARAGVNADEKESVFNLDAVF